MSAPRDQKIFGISLGAEPKKVKALGGLLVVLNGFAGGNLVDELRRFREELLFADLEIATTRLDKLHDQLRKPRPAKHIWIIATRDIEPGEELTYDYNLYDGDDDDEALCQCGAKECRGSMYGEEELERRAKEKAKSK